jgi:hypothetical protein
MDLTNKFKAAAQKIEFSVRKFNLNPKYLIIFSFILCLKAYFELINNNIISFLLLMIISQLIVEVYLINIKYQTDKENQNYHLLNQKLNYIKFMVYIAVIFLKFNKSVSFLNIIILLLGFILYIYYSPCYSDNLSQESETDFSLLNGKDKIKRIFKNKNSIFNNFLFNDICTLIYLLLIVIILSIY